MAIKCEVCCINDAQAKDYRNVEGMYGKYLVCPNCFILNDKWFFRLNYAKEGVGKKRILSQITEGSWKDYLITK
ncbi:MAG: hypothetical protein AB1393_07205 [Candidatus Edwardsbacteria bacterium]